MIDTGVVPSVAGSGGSSRRRWNSRRSSFICVIVRAQGAGRRWLPCGLHGCRSRGHHLRPAPCALPPYLIALSTPSITRSASFPLAGTSGLARLGSSIPHAARIFCARPSSVGSLAADFAQDLRTPPIATDIGEIPGRDELIRAMALGIYQVDPVTRRVSPHGPVTNGSLARIAARVLVLRGAACAKAAASDPTELGRAQKILAACNVPDLSAASPDVPASGRDAERVMDGVNAAIK